MRKLLIATWTIAACLLLAGFLIPVAYDTNVSRNTWCQIAIIDGTVRLMVVHSDPSASTVAATVYEREISTWRNVVSGDMWGRYDRWTQPVDEIKTSMTTLRLDVPLAWILILIPLSPVGVWVFKRYRAPPRLIWKELRARQPGRSRFGHLRSSFVVISFCSAAIAIIILRSITYSGLSSGPSYSYDWGAVVLPPVRPDPYLWARPPSEQTLAARDQFEQGGSSKQYVTVQVLHDGRVVFRLFKPSPNGGQRRQRRQKFTRYIVGIKITTMTTFGPIALGYWGSGYIEQVTSGTGSPPTIAGIEHSIEFRLSSLAMLMLIYPLIRFFRGPLRRARWRANGCCRWCGYDLTGNESGVCPECGEDATYISDFPTASKPMPVWLPRPLRALKRFTAPPRLVWSELRTRVPNQRRSVRIGSSVVCVASLLLVFATVFVWYFGQRGFMRDWSRCGNWYALALPIAQPDPRSNWFDLRSDEPPLVPIGERRDGGPSIRFAISPPSRYVTVEGLRFGRIRAAYFTLNFDAKPAAEPVSFRFAGIDVSRTNTQAPRFLEHARSLPIGSIMGVERSVILPCWIVLTAALIFPLTLFYRGPLRRARRRANGCCRWCGYDLTGNESGVCPECGEDATYLR
jgi:hypothetical protein